MNTMNKGISIHYNKNVQFFTINKALHSVNVSGCGDPLFKVDYFKTVSRWKLIALRGVLSVYLFKLRSPLKRLT